MIQVSKLIGGLDDVEFTRFYEHVELYEIYAQEDRSKCLE